MRAQCYLRDLFPTICELAGIAAPKRRWPKPACPSSAARRHEIYPFIVGYFQDSQRMIREGNWKLVWYPKIDRWQLFDLTADPNELNDLSGEPSLKKRIDALRSKLITWLIEHGDPLFGMPSPR